MHYVFLMQPHVISASLGQPMSFVTQAAVSHQIKSLEDFLGLKLFRRRNRSLLLTEEGQSYFQDIKEIFRN